MVAMATHLRAVWPLLLGGLGAALPGQHAAGRVLGFDGQPAAAVVVRAVDAKARLLGEVLTTADGRFELLVDQPVHALRVQNEGVHLELPQQNGGRVDQQITFVGVAHFTVRGHVVDPGGAIAAGVDLVCRDAERHSVVTTTTDARGAFAIRANRPVHDILVDPAGWQHVEAGPWQADRGLAIDLRLLRDSYFCLRGRCLDERGQPLPGLRIHGDHDGQRIAWTTSGADGRFTLWARRPLSHLTAFDGPPRMGRAGPWQQDAELDLDEREHGLVLVTGRIVDQKGVGAGGVAIFGVAGPVRPPRRSEPVGVTSRDGSFCVRLPRHQSHLWFWQENGNQQGFAEIRPGQSVAARLDR